MQVNKKTADKGMYSSGRAGVPLEDSLAHDALARKVKKKRRPKSSPRKPHQKGKSGTFESTKFRQALIRSIENSNKKGKATRHSRNPSHFGSFSRVGIRSSIIISIIISSILMTSAYASLGPIVLNGDLTKVMNDMLSFTKNKNGNYRSQLARDHIPPTISALKDLVVEATGALTVVPLAAPAVTDNVDRVLTVTNNASFDGYPLGTYGIAWTASVGVAYAKDAVDSSPSIINDAPVDGFPLGTSTVTWSATDSSGNSVTATQLVSVLAAEATQLISTLDTTPSTDPTSSSFTETPNSSPSTSGSYSGGGGGGGGSGPISSPDPSINPATITDNTPPTIIPPPPIFANAAGPLTLVALSLPTVSDTQDPNPTVTNNAPANGFPVGTTIVIWRATDYSGNHGTAEQKIVIEDKSPPLLVAPSNILAEATGVKTSVSLGTPIVSDLVDLYPFVSNDAPLGYAIGNSTVTWKAKDASGNSVTASQTVTIVDTTPPTIVAPADIMINSTGALTSISIGSAVANDRVDPSPLVTNNAPANGFLVGKTTVTLTATDASGNSAKDTQIVAVTNAQPPIPVPGNTTNPDVIPPTIIAPPDVTTEATGLLTLVVLGTPTVTDNEDPAPTVTNDAPSSGFPVGNTTVTWTATDASGNSATATQKISINKVVAGGCTATSQPPCFDFTPSAVSYTFCSAGCNYNNLQTALNALPTGGGTIKIKNVNNVAGNYNVPSNTIIEFESNARLTITTGNPVFNIDNKQNVKILNAYVTTTHSGVKMVDCMSSRWITIDGGKAVLVKGSGSTLMYADSCSDLIFKNFDGRTATRIVDFGTVAGPRDGTCDNVWVYNVRAQDSSIEGIKINHCDNVYIWNNHVQDTADNGIDIGFNLNTDIRHNTVVRGGVPNGVGIHTDQTDTALIYNNTFDQSGGSAISVCGANGVTARQNTMTNSNSTSIVIIKCNSGLTSSTNTTIEGNIITNSGAAGIYVTTNQANTVIKNNIISIFKTSCIIVNSPNLTVTKIDNICSP
ncbi:MAG: HYR domain-containing protein [Thaumarchaeota archaeon]|nr:MAG: HYR domain-containing protein [Nitrososphaerota archaeon]